MMATPQCIDIVIPVYNEGKNIVPVMRAFERQIKSPFRVLICYDHDEDDTLLTLRQLSFPFEIIPVKNKGKFAHGAAVTGFYESNAPAVISYMADDDYNAGVIDAMIDHFHQGSDIVVGSRFIPGGSMQGCRWQKAVPVVTVAYTLHHLARLPVHDPTNAFRLFSRRLLDRVNIESSQGFTYSIELLVKCHRLGWKMSEVPVQWYERTKGSSRFKVFKWASAYLHWYFYAFETTYLHAKTI
jgi:dolichol-phosphate mannosyltransferase